MIILSDLIWPYPVYHKAQNEVYQNFQNQTIIQMLGSLREITEQKSALSCMTFVCDK
jgi:hypothetical protein